MVLLVRPGRVSYKGKSLDSAKFVIQGVELTEKFEILSALQLIEADICFDSDTGSRVTKIRIVARNNGKSFSFGLPREVCDGICERRLSEKGKWLHISCITFQLNNFDRVALFTHAEYFQVAEY